MTTWNLEYYARENWEHRPCKDGWKQLLAALKTRQVSND